MIAVTASAFGDTREAAREAGCVDYLPKPVRAEALFAALQTHLGVRFVPATELRRPPRHSLDRPRRGAGAARCAKAAAIGSVTDLEALAHELRGRRSRPAGSARPADRAAGGSSTSTMRLPRAGRADRWPV